jgi:hypothetical protein
MKFQLFFQMIGFPIFSSLALTEAHQQSGQLVVHGDFIGGVRVHWPANWETRHVLEVLHVLGRSCEPDHFERFGVLFIRIFGNPKGFLFFKGVEGVSVHLEDSLGLTFRGEFVPCILGQLHCDTFHFHVWHHSLWRFRVWGVIPIYPCDSFEVLNDLTHLILSNKIQII